MNILKKLLGVFTGFGCIVYISMIFTEKEKVPFVIAAIIFALFTFLLFRPKKIDTTKQQTVVAENTALSTNPKICSVCGGKIHGHKIQLSDGNICSDCNFICNKNVLVSVIDVREAWTENHKRNTIFSATNTLHNMGSGYIHIDAKNKLCYVSSRKNLKVEPVIFKFSEIEDYKIEEYGSKTVIETKSKGAIKRAVVGGVLTGGVGAVIGASTAKKESTVKKTQAQFILYITISFDKVKTTLALSNPPVGASDFLTEAMAMED
mgnify:FL=1